MEKSLYNIEDEYLELVSKIYESEGEITEEIEQALIINESELKQKAIGYSKVIKQVKGEISIIDEEIKRLQGEKKKRVNLEIRLKGALTNSMDTYEIEKLETPLCKVSFRKSESVEITDINLLTDDYVKLEKKPLKKELKEALKLGKVIGAELVTNKSIQIK